MIFIFKTDTISYFCHFLTFKQRGLTNFDKITRSFSNLFRPHFQKNKEIYKHRTQ